MAQSNLFNAAPAIPRETGLQRLPRAAVNGIEFPYTRCSVRGSQRHHVHEYPHAPGGAYEPLGRKLYEIKLSCPFHETFVLYPDLWPGRLDRLRDLFESGFAVDLTIPTIGTIKARCINWEQIAEARVQSGEAVELDFIEDQQQLFLVDALVRKAAETMTTVTSTYTVEHAASGINLTIFDQIQAAANAVLAIVDQVELFGNILEAKVRGLQALIEEADATVDFLQHPENLGLWDAMRDLWAAGQRLLDDLLTKRSPLAIYTVPMTMPIADVSSAIYGDATHGIELLQLNAVDDAFAVPAGTPIKYYPAE